MNKSNGVENKRPPQTASKEQTKLPNILRLDDDDDLTRNLSNDETKNLVDRLVKLEPIQEAMNIE